MSFPFFYPALIARAPTKNNKKTAVLTIENSGLDYLKPESRYKGHTAFHVARTQYMQLTTGRFSDLRLTSGLLPTRYCFLHFVSSLQKTPSGQWTNVPRISETSRSKRLQRRVRYGLEPYSRFTIQKHKFFWTCGQVIFFSKSFSADF